MFLKLDWERKKNSKIVQNVFLSLKELYMLNEENTKL